MKTPDHERLIGDVLRDESYDVFRAELRQKMLEEVKRVRRYRRIKPLLALAACVPLAFAAHWLLQSRALRPAQPNGIATVRSVPLRADQIVTTAQANRRVAVVASHSPDVALATVSTVTLADTGLSDEELLNLFKGRAVALVSFESGKKLVFLDEGGSQ